jgi:PhoPQ-activated pathogenicity-related protein
LAGNLCEATPLDDYVNKPDSNYAWFDTKQTVTGMAFGGVGHVLNVTSQQWLDASFARGPYGAVWSHQVVVLVPKVVEIKNVSMAYLTGGCNEHPGEISNKDEDVLVADAISFNTKAVVIVVFQLPNCHYHFAADKLAKARGEDALIAFAWDQYLNVSSPMPHSAEWLPRLPMTKAAMQAMRAAGEFLEQNTIAKVEGWIVSGASKRGWTTWTVGAVTCPSCVTIVGICPLVPIVPNLLQEMHRQWRSYGGWTFAFSDYTALNLTERVDDPQFKEALRVIDPAYYSTRLQRLPKLVVLSSDDEFMQFDWSEIWYDQLSGEKHLLIAPNSEHSLSTGIPEVLESISAFVKSIALGHTADERPAFSYTRNASTGEIAVSISAPFRDHKGLKVVLRHGQTLQSTRRDFRWVRKADNDTGACTLPDIPLKKPLFGGNCIQPITWWGKTLHRDADGYYRALPPHAKKGHWMGYYIEVFLPSDEHLLFSDFQFTTPGFVWPDTLPFPDCHGANCTGHLV